MVKAYLRYEPTKVFGVIASIQSNTVSDDTGKLAVAPALEDVVIWDLKKGIQTARWHESNCKSEVTCIARSPNTTDYAVGYTDGSIRIWNIKTSLSTVTFNGHRSAVTALVFDRTGTRLASGSRDTDLIIWDIIGEVGMYRLRGHKDQISQLYFLTTPNTSSSSDVNENEENDALDGVDKPLLSDQTFLLSSSKDTLLKLWDLSTQHCIDTLVGHRSEVWSFDVTRDQKRIISGGGDPELRVWSIDWEVLRKGREENMDGDIDVGKEIDGNILPKKAITHIGLLPRASKERIVTIQFHLHANFLALHAADKSVELYRIRTLEEVKKKMTRRKKRQKEKKQKAGEDVEMEDGELEVKITDEITLYHVIRTSAKVRSLDFMLGKDVERAGNLQILTSLVNNSLEVYVAPLPPKDKASKASAPEPSRLYSIDLQGHRSDIRTVALSSDDELLCSASNNILKIWNVKTGICIRSIECGYALCSSFLPGNRHIIVGTKNGDLELYDIASSSSLEAIKAHEGAIWSLQVRPDKRGLVTGSADKDVKFWDFDMVEEVGKANNGAKKLTLVHMRTLKMSEDVLCVRYSPDQNLLAISLLDATVKVFYHDTLKFFLSLYGHKLPVLSMDISSDNQLLVTCSADKNVKIWGLDFGDCHKSIFAHQDSIMVVQFVWGTHYFFTGSKDRAIKYWDGDKFENIMKLENHHGEIWTLAIARHGNFVVSGSHDRSLRVWERTEEQLFLEEEREKELEELYESTLANSMEATTLKDIQKENLDELGSAGRQTMETLKAGERIIEALDIGDEDKKTLAQYEESKTKGLKPAVPQKNPVLVAMGGLTGDQYVLRTIEKIRSSDLEEALLVLPFAKVTSLMAYLNEWAKKDWNTPLTCRILFSLLKIHHNQIVANRVMRVMLDSIRLHLRATLQRQKDVVGYNVAALKFMKRDWEARKISEFGEELPPEEGESRKRKFVTLTG